MSDDGIEKSFPRISDWHHEACRVMSHTRIQEFSSGGSRQSYKNSSDVFFSPQPILQKSNGQFQRNLSFFQGSRGVLHFPGGGPTFSRGGPIAYSL